MFAAVKWQLRLGQAILLVLAFTACGEKEKAPMTSQPRHSGYAGSADDWKRFLGCWQQGFPAPANHADRVPALRGEVRPNKAPASEALADLEAAEKRLGIRLPASYRDFVLAFAALPRPAGETLENYTGLLPPNQIGFAQDLSPLSVQLAAEHPLESPDEEYLVYGVGQDDVAMRSSYMPRAIILGKYGPDSPEEILLYPQLATKDGEMEAALGYHAGQFRAPSFAELMRQLSHLELAGPNTVPPYPQAQLRGSCADLLPMREVWWP